MRYIRTPMTILEEDGNTRHPHPLLSDKNGEKGKTIDSKLRIARNIEQTTTMLDNLIDIVVFTPKGSFTADPDFGLAFWTQEYANLRSREFNNGHTTDMTNSEITKEECEESIRRSIATFAPEMHDLEVTLELNACDESMRRRKKVPSKYKVTIHVSGRIDNGLGTMSPYTKDVEFLVEPAMKTTKRQ